MTVDAVDVTSLTRGRRLLGSAGAGGRDDVHGDGKRVRRPSRRRYKRTESATEVITFAMNDLPSRYGPTWLMS